MRFDILTLFPELIEAFASSSVIGRGRAAGCFELETHQIRDYSADKHHRVDDTPYGGGKGMLMSAEPVCACHADAAKDPQGKYPKTRTIFLSPKGKVLTQKKAEELSSYDRLILLCGHYEGIDRRAIDEVVDEEISCGDYVLTGGELPACILIDCVARLLPGVLAAEECYENESIACGMLEYPQYTRPEVFHGVRVPQVLLDGNHKEIDKWRYKEAVELTKKLRPDLI